MGQGSFDDKLEWVADHIADTENPSEVNRSALLQWRDRAELATPVKAVVNIELIVTSKKAG